MLAMTEGESFVRGLAAAIPEAFAGADLDETYNYAEYTAADDDPWVKTIALADAVEWIEAQVLDVDRRLETVAVRPRCEDALERFFSYMEHVIAAAAAKPERTNWIAIELFEGIPWTENVSDYLGAHTLALLRDAQATLGVDSGWIGRWSD
jgi:hypothetical protein